MDNIFLVAKFLYNIEINIKKRREKMSKLKKIVLLIILFAVNTGYSFKIDRVILGCDTNPMYIDFWPLVAKAWKKIVGVKPTLALIAPKDFKIDESLGKVIRFEPLPDIPTSFQAQVIRLLLPAYFEDEVCIISDMDMIPVQKNYFVNAVAGTDKKCFVVYKDGAFDSDHNKEYPMCYNAASGKTFKEIFHISKLSEIKDKIKEWYALNLGWSTDQQILYRALNNWKDKKTRLIKLGHDVHPRIDRIKWKYDKNRLKDNYYIDAHLLRPYSKYKAEINKLAFDLHLIDHKTIYDMILRSLY